MARKACTYLLTRRLRAAFEGAEAIGTALRFGSDH